ncbi:MAG: tyrosine decarboxylase [Bacteroidetes bacterium]|nr:tyrosine decarboxylase [Bacteroidota bacterium]
MKKEHHVNIDALFIGPKSENIKFFKETICELIDEHAFWRKDFHPEDDPIIGMGEQQEKHSKDTEQRILETLQKMSSRLRTTSMPWHSPRYLGHMNTDILIPAILGYVGAMLYNPNNVAYEASTATSPMELEVGMDFARLMGFDMEKAWGHICTDGSVANLEGIWYARNIASIPFAVKAVRPELVKEMSDWELANMTVPAILDLAAKVKDVWEEIRNHSVRGTGVIPGQLGKWIVPQSKHYSWVKAGEISGIGLNNVINIQVDNNFRMDIKVLEKTINDLAAKKIPVLGIVGVLGTTEEGAIDHFDQIIALRKKFEKNGISFYVHADMAYGGYARSIFLDEKFQFLPYNDLKVRLHKEGVINQDSIDWPPKEVYDAFEAVSEADSITIDPHKMGYVPYAAGGIVIKDKRMLDAISFFAAYVFEKGTDVPSLLGSYILEGSKAGATAAGVWAAHQVVPLNMLGYGRLIGASIETAQRAWGKSQEIKTLEIDGVKFKLETLVKPDFNMVDFAFNYEGNSNLEKMNQLNLDIYNLSSYVAGPVTQNDFITSHTVFSFDNYGDAPADLAGRLGIPFKEWKKVKELRVMRACIMTPYLTKDKIAKNYWDDYLNSMKRKLAEIVNQK